MTDKELLEAAAKAAGIKVLPLICWPYRQGSLGLWIQVGDHRTAVGWWNPLDDDGDALRLAIQLGINICFSGTRWGVAMRPIFDICCEWESLDRPAQIRLAITHAAALSYLRKLV